MRRKPESDIYNERGPALVGRTADRFLAHLSTNAAFLMTGGSLSASPESHGRSSRMTRLTEIGLFAPFSRRSA
jgi:hypothetical protein